jgi:hypothetical protein
MTDQYNPPWFYNPDNILQIVRVVKICFYDFFILLPIRPNTFFFSNIGRSLFVVRKAIFLYCDRFDGTSDMNAASQRIRRPSLDNGLWKAVARQRLGKQCLKQECWSPLPRQRILLTVKFPKQPNCCDGRYNCERRCSISGPGDPLKVVDLDSQESVNNSQPVS